MVSVKNFWWCKQLGRNMQSVLYCRIKGITTDLIPHWVLTLRVWVACLIPIFYLLMRLTGETSICCLHDVKVWCPGTLSSTDMLAILINCDTPKDSVESGPSPLTLGIREHHRVRVLFLVRCQMYMSTSLQVLLCWCHGIKEQCHAICRQWNRNSSASM